MVKDNQCESLGRLSRGRNTGAVSWKRQKRVINNILNDICYEYNCLENCADKDSRVIPWISGLQVNPRPSL